MTETIQQLKEDIAILQEKLRKLEEQDPEMLLLRQGKVDIVDYDGKKYFRIEYTDSFAGEYRWYVRNIGEDAVRPVWDVNVYAPLEELYQKQVVKQKDDYPYKKYTPEETEESLEEAFREGLKQVEKMKEVQQKIDDGYFNDFIFIDRPNLLDFLKDKLGYSTDSCYEIVDAISEWLPETQNASGSQNAYVESAVEGWNDAINAIRGKLQ